MGKIKQKLIEEEDALAAVNRRTAGVSDSGGDAMSGGMMAFLDSLAADSGQEVREQAHDEVVAALEIAERIPSPASTATILPTPPSEEAIPVEILFEMPPRRYMKQGQHYNLVFHGVCTNCAHCALKLSDSVSIERGIGPICSKRGYMEDPKDPDEMQAMIDLAEFPDLVEFLVKNYKPKGVRALMNGLVKIASLNRRSPVHQACCEAIDSLGYKRLASTLRESLKVVEIKEHDSLHYNVWVKKAEYSWQWSNDIRRHIPNAYLSRQAKGLIVPKSAKNVLWALVLKHYANLVAQVPDGQGGKKAVRIKEQTMAPPASSPQLTPS